ncbi:4427_t:CDS:2 [Cetraspora pellucida]|uniref:4427_t:CDS:1 n=1 Tax=Cetraspora pellucida TaxID=1433469 RepID=A0A9N9GNK9_9GLOM|nr:4427_t:CDS:2 [Cetraspora pellucida]
MAGDVALKFIKKYSQVSKKPLFRSTKDGLLFLDTLRKDHTKPILSAVEEILQQQEIVTNCLFDYQEVYSLVEASTWNHAQQYIPFENKVLAIMLYLDATILDCLEKSSSHPIYISLENIPTNLHNRVESKALVGIIPILQETKEE